MDVKCHKDVAGAGRSLSRERRAAGLLAIWFLFLLCAGELPPKIGMIPSAQPSGEMPARVCDDGFVVVFWNPHTFDPSITKSHLISPNISKYHLFFEKCLEFAMVKKPQKDGCAQKRTTNSGSICSIRRETNFSVSCVALL